VLIEECKMGSSWNGSRRLDAWALLKTWSPWTTIGYEIKTDRSDFLRDRKWTDYLPVCHELYFVSPAKLIAPEELPESVGLLWTTGGSRLVTKRKAVRRDPDPQALCSLMSYALMSRVRIVENMWQAQDVATPAERWRQVLASNEADRELGRLVSRRIREALHAAERRALTAEETARRLQSIQERLDAIGLGDCRSVWDIERRLGHGKKLAEIEDFADRIKLLASQARPSARAALSEDAKE
jgi:hypothetical protein